MSKGLGVRAVFCGSGSLLVHCAEAFQAAGGEIVGLISSAAPTCAWAASAGVAQAPEPTEDVFPDTPFELFFSIGYLRVLPSALVGRARKLAVNFHDGPLPGRAGLNAPAWAILDGEREHGISWHEITSELDQGSVLVSRRFPIASGDTAFHLNARCYEEGLSAFQELVDAIQGECVVPVTQDAPSVWRGGADRPRGLGIIDPMGARSDTIRHIRALSFGPYSNPLCLPKIWTGSKLLVVGEGAPEHMELSPGELGLATPDRVHLGQQDGSLRLSGLMDLEGRAISAEREGLSTGNRLPVPPELDAETLHAVGATENTWRETLEQAAPALPAFPRHHGRRGTLRHFPLDAMASESALAAAWLAWVAGVNGGARGSLAIAGETPHPCLSARRPVTLEIVGTPRSLTDAMSAAITHARARAAMAVDLPLRLGSEDARATAQSTLSVVLAEDEISGEPTVALLANPVRLAIALSAYDEDVAVALARDFEAYLQAFLAAPDEEIGALPLTDAGDLEGPVIGFDTMARIGDGLSRHAEERPEAVAVECGGASLSFAALENSVEGLAAALSERGAGPGTVVGVSLPRSPDLVVALFAVLRAGAAYLPLDPEYPASRTQYMVADAGASIVIATPETAECLALRDVQVVGPKTRATPSPGRPGTADDPAYLMYTSGSSGQPKGVVVPHRAVVNVFGSMDALAAMEPGARVLAETSVSFDISVLEIFWTISRGATVVLRSAAKDARRPEFSLFYFGSEASVPREAGEDAYRLLFEGAKFADQNGFSAVWTPERHFHTFGGLYPNPSLTASALAGVTRNVALRAGSVVLPLHHPVRLAEDWALVDNLSNGRAGLALAAGWQPNDFVLRPEAFKDRKVETLSGVKALRALWRGEALDFPGPDGVPVATKVHPCPVQAEIPLWLTAAGNPETFAAAGRLGCGLLTHLLGQTFDELAEKIRTYREAWAEAGHMGAGHVVLMLHTFVGESEEEVLTAAKGPMKAYLDGAVDLVRRAAWSFPTLADRAEVQGRTPGDVLEAEDLSEEETDQLLEHAFERYYQSAGLFGTPESVGEIIEKARSI
ncbi:MAG: MupA/Atu3671 family FMN-dependent luciferase-like monooxygenase, partial [Pseudomonadota bacterium]